MGGQGTWPPYREIGPFGGWLCVSLLFVLLMHTLLDSMAYRRLQSFFFGGGSGPLDPSVVVPMV